MSPEQSLAKHIRPSAQRHLQDKNLKCSQYRQVSFSSEEDTRLTTKIPKKIAKNSYLQWRLNSQINIYMSFTFALSNSAECDKCGTMLLFSSCCGYFTHGSIPFCKTIQFFYNSSFSPKSWQNPAGMDIQWIVIRVWQEMINYRKTCICDHVIINQIWCQTPKNLV